MIIDDSIKKEYAPPPPLEMSFAQTARKNEVPSVSNTIQSPTSPIKEFRPQILKRIPPPSVVKEEVKSLISRESSKPVSFL
jgi:hypothetical protein